MKAIIARQPAWCFPPHAREGAKGLVRFEPHGTATLSDGGKVIARGTWREFIGGNDVLREELIAGDRCR